jgi:hypothetical protein
MTIPLFSTLYISAPKEVPPYPKLIISDLSGKKKWLKKAQFKKRAKK